MSFWGPFPDQRLLVEISLWSADFKRLGDEISRVDEFADLYHIDVSDGHFVPGFLFFEDLVAALRPLTGKPFHVHLMTINPLLHVDGFVQAGADLVTIHAENGPLVPAALQRIRSQGAAAGIALGLDVDPFAIQPYLEMLDLVLMMGTPMGVKGVEPSTLAFERMARMRALIDQHAPTGQIKIAADGGIRLHTVPRLRAAGADLIVAGSLAFKAEHLAERFAGLHGLPPYDMRLP